MRMRLSMGVLVLAFLYGLWETYGALTGPDTNNGLIFGVLFIAASFYGGFQLMKDFGDSVGTLDRDGDTLTATLWRPWGTLKIAGPSERFTNWRFHIAMAKRNQRMPLIRVDHPDYPRPLAMELKPGVTPLEGCARGAGRRRRLRGSGAGEDSVGLPAYPPPITKSTTSLRLSTTMIAATAQRDGAERRRDREGAHLPVGRSRTAPAG